MTELLPVMSSDDRRFWSHPSTRTPYHHHHHHAVAAFDPSHRRSTAALPQATPPVVMAVPATYSYSTQHGTSVPLVISVPTPNAHAPPMYLVPQEILSQQSYPAIQPLRATARNVFAVFPTTSQLQHQHQHQQNPSVELEDDVRFLQELLLSPCTTDDHLATLHSESKLDAEDAAADDESPREPYRGSLQALLQTAVQLPADDADALSTGSASASSSPTNLMTSSRRTRQLPPSRICRVPGCTKGIRSRGLCKGHGGGRRCTTPGCTISDQGGGHCIAHGGGKRCTVDGCDKSAQYKGLCKVHGGSRRCRFPDCSKNGQIRGLCRVHFSMVEGADTTTSLDLQQLQQRLQHHHHQQQQQQQEPHRL
ncbi:hypothetical protein PINS_up022592 [Pythium insidiosum]|nr:hypothetical protein PINS_up006505 [Pythium insidiosum]GLE10470.1 hypothetical protein PINS_up022592 [Pythium insidiosum]